MSGWRIRYEGQPRNPRFRVKKRRTFRMRGTKAQAEKAAEDLVEHQGVKIIWIAEEI